MKLLGRLMYEVERRTAIAKDYLFILFKIVNPKIAERGIWHSDELATVDKFRLLIEANYKDERKPSFYAGELGLSVEKLRVLLKNVLGKRFYDVLNARAFAEANVLLLTDMPIGDIAYEVGFSHSSHFDMTYIRFYGISPGTYRKRNRKS
ncbi:MAG: AraC family transcriptional regulator [Pedobacter sp.]|nr:MAG: AraC family transcriptional regulator [Pedobacter sp.]